MFEKDDQFMIRISCMVITDARSGQPALAVTILIDEK